MLNTLLPASLFTHHMPQGSGTGPSGQILGAMAGATTNPDGSKRLTEGMSEDFDGAISLGAGTAGFYKELSWYKDTGGTIISDVTALGGIVTCVTGSSDNDELTVKGGPAGILDGDPVFFEARVLVTLDLGDKFIGLTDPGAAAADVISDDGTLPDANFFGFKINASNEISFVMRNTGAAETVILATAILGEASGWHSFGFIYSRRPLSSSHEKLQVYLDNVSKGQVAGTVLTDALTPKDSILAPVISFKNTSAAVATSKIDWGYCHSVTD